jgi:hypothetical protein
MATFEQLIHGLRVQAGDHGCEQCFEHLEHVLEMPAGSGALRAAVAHLRGCRACAEDAEGLVALINPASAGMRVSRS